jgi:hypothetical protein
MSLPLSAFLDFSDGCRAIQKFFDNVGKQHPSDGCQLVREDQSIKIIWT